MTYDPGTGHAIEQLRIGGVIVLYDDQRDQGDQVAAGPSPCLRR